MNQKVFVNSILMALFGLTLVGLDATRSAACEPTGGPKFDGPICIPKASFGWTGPCREYVNGVPADKNRIIDYVEFRVMVVPAMGGLPYEKSVVLKRPGSICTPLPATDGCMQDWLVKGNNNNIIVRAMSLGDVNLKLGDKTGAEFWLYYTWMCMGMPPIAQPNDQVTLRIFYAMIDPTVGICDYKEAKQPFDFQIVPKETMICR
jgi:hypothetical protein